MERGADRLNRRADGGDWPGGARAAVSITIDNLGEAAEIELGLRDPDAVPGGHYSVTTALPIVLATLADAGLSATFFVEGVNAEIYPQALHEIGAAGHELGYHAWCHEDWASLDEAAEIANLDRGLAAMRALGIDVLGMRPPGGRLTEKTLGLLAGRGLRYCSPAGSAAGIDQVAVVPFAWPAVDAFHILPAFAPLRKRLTGDGEPGGPDAVRAALLESVERALDGGAHATLVLHTWLIELARDAVHDVLARVGEAAEAGELWVAPCYEAVAWMTSADRQGIGALPVGAPPVLDHTSWTAPA
ncbi:MAG TPA: polysaccharide deacetylase family protein [Solirubrobacteraceae bacterium]